MSRSRPYQLVDVLYNELSFQRIRLRNFSLSEAKMCDNGYSVIIPRL
jgi:hypothetical protein